MAIASHRADEHAPTNRWPATQASRLLVADVQDRSREPEA